VRVNERLEFLVTPWSTIAGPTSSSPPIRSCNEGSGRWVAFARRNESYWPSRDASGPREWMRIGRGVKKEHGLERPSLLADAFEALVAAIYWSNGYDAAKRFIQRPSPTPSRGRDAPGDSDPKNRLRQCPRRTASARRTTR